MGSFSTQILRYTEKTKKNIDELSVDVTKEVFNTAVRPMRVDTGRMRRNNQVTQNTPATSTLEAYDPNLGMDLINAEATKIKPASLNIMANNLSYTQIWEEVDSYYGRAQAAFQSIVQEKAAKYK